MTGPTRRDLEKRVAELRGDDAEDVEIIWRDEVIETEWSDGKDDPPEPGITVTRYYRNEAGKWTSEEVGQHDG